MSDQKQRQRGNEAKMVLDNPVYRESWDAIRGRLLVIMEGAKSTETMLKAQLALGLLNDLKGHMQRIMNDGAVAAATIELEEQKQAQQRKRWQRAA